MYGTNLPPFVAPMKRARKCSPGPTEDQIHRAVVRHLYARAAPDVEWWHTPNGGKRNEREGKKFKEMGVKRGVADLILVRHCDNYALELKSLTGRATVEQMEWLSRMAARGWHTCVCHGLDRALQILETWGLLR